MMVEINDMVRFMGVIKTTGFTPFGLFKNLSEGEIYKVKRILHRTEGDYYFISSNIKHPEIGYPVENFEQVYSRDYISNKYDLK